MANSQMAEKRGQHFNAAEQYESNNCWLVTTQQCLHLLKGAPKQVGTELMGFIALAIKYWNCYS